MFGQAWKAPRMEPAQPFRATSSQGMTVLTVKKLFFFLSSFCLMPLTFLSYTAVKSLMGKLPNGYWQAPGKVPQNFPVSSLPQPLVLLLPSAACAPVWPHLPCVHTNWRQQSR